MSKSRSFPLRGVALSLLVALGARALPAHAGVWVGDGSGGRLAVTFRYQGSPETGRFARFRVRLVTRHGVPRALTVVVRTASLTFSSSLLDRAARGPLWFDAARHPVAVYSARRFLVGARADRVTGTLRLKGVVRPLALLLHVVRTTRGTLVLRGRARVPRLLYRIGTGPWAKTSLIGNRVDLVFRVSLARTGA
jgi:polyisoprenoid-binding protein YceI